MSIYGQSYVPTLSLPEVTNEEIPFQHIHIISSRVVKGKKDTVGFNTELSGLDVREINVSQLIKRLN